MNGKWRLAEADKATADRNWAHRTVENSALGSKPQPIEAVAKPRSAGKGCRRCLRMRRPGLCLFCILRYFAASEYLPYLKRDHTQPPYSGSLHSRRLRLLPALRLRTSTTCKTNAGHHRSCSESWCSPVRSKKRRRFGVIMCYGDRGRPPPQFSKDTVTALLLPHINRHTVEL